MDAGLVKGVAADASVIEADAAITMARLPTTGPPRPVGFVSTVIYSPQWLLGALIMKQQKSKWMPLVSTLSATAMFLVQPLRAEVLERSKQVNDTIVHYKVVLPNDY